METVILPKIIPNARIVLLLAITIAGILPVSVYLAMPAAHGMSRFNSSSELEQFLLSRSRCGYGQVSTTPTPGTPVDFGTVRTAGQNVQADSSAGVSAVPSHSETNNQVAGVDELDTIKNDGQYIYTVSNNTVLIVQAYPVSSARLLARISLGDIGVQGIFVDGNRLAIVAQQPEYSYGMIGCGSPQYSTTRVAGISAECFGCNRYVRAQNTTVLVYDLTSRSSPILQTSATINGSFVGARRIGDMAYIVSTSPAVCSLCLPVVTVNGLPRRIDATEIYHSDVSDGAFGYTTVLGLDLADEVPKPAVETFLLGTSSTIYVSNVNIFLTQPTWENQIETVVHRITILGSAITYEATGAVPGHVLNQFSMDETNGYFRITTSDNGWGGRGTGVYVLDESMKIVGGLEGLAPNEQFHAARFMGDKAYLVTFLRTDPLFVIDLSIPSKPSLLGQLNVTGVSDYLQPYDSTHLIGIGKSAQTVQWENAALFMGFKLSLFDVSNPTQPADLSDYGVGDRGTSSPAWTDQKAVLFDRSLNLLVVPILVASQTGPSIWYYQFESQGAYVFQVTLEQGIAFKGVITHIPVGYQPTYADSPYFVTRSLYIGSVLYTISGMMIEMNSLVDLSQLGSISLA